MFRVGIKETDQGRVVQGSVTVPCTSHYSQVSQQGLGSLGTVLRVHKGTEDSFKAEASMKEGSGGGRHREIR